MIEFLASPTVCVIDEDPDEFPLILKALNSLNIGCVHIKGDDATQLPEAPLKGLRLVFTDLYLSSGAVGKAMASHTANVFRHVVSADTAPVLVVIWSKHVSEIADSNLPPAEEISEADLFIEALFEFDGKYRERLIFLKLSKPVDLPESEDWVPQLKDDIIETLKGQEATRALWIWESMVKRASAGVSESLTSMSQMDNMGGSLADRLKVTLRLLAAAQSDGKLSGESATRHLTTALAQLLYDQLENSINIDASVMNGTWLCEPLGEPMAEACKATLNGGLLTAAAQDELGLFPCGMIYKIKGYEVFKKLFEIELHEFMYELSINKNLSFQNWQEWLQLSEPVLLEISPACDIAQNNRNSALLIAGLISPAALHKSAQSNGGAFFQIPKFKLRWELETYGSIDSFLIFCSRYKVTLSPKTQPAGLHPWFRLRELPTAALRNWHAGNAARVGYMSL